MFVVCIFGCFCNIFFPFRERQRSGLSGLPVFSSILFCCCFLYFVYMEMKLWVMSLRRDTKSNQVKSSHNYVEIPSWNNFSLLLMKKIVDTSWIVFGNFVSFFFKLWLQQLARPKETNSDPVTIMSRFQTGTTSVHWEWQGLYRRQGIHIHRNVLGRWKW